MNATITINQRGNLTLPAIFRKKMGIKPNDQLSVEARDGGILLRPTFSVPIEMYTDKQIKEFDKEEAKLGKLLSK